MSIILYSVPAFFLLIGVELLVAHLMKKPYYRLNDGVNDLNCGILSQLFGLFTRFATAGLYIFLYEHFRLWTIPAGSVVYWVALFLLVDHQYYWFHRWAHRATAGWAAHVVHHQSEDLNLAVALRQSAFQGLFSIWFHLPLALMGFSPVDFFIMYALNTVAQFWVHTRLIKSLGPLEWVLNTPAHHRVHHAKNPKYIDKNYAGALIIFDRMYGTFEPEVEEPVYGVTEPLNSWNPIWANFKTWRDAWRNVADARWTDKVRVWFMPPEWVPAGKPAHPPHPELDARTYVKYDPALSSGMKWYLFLQFVTTVAATLWILIQAPKLDMASRFAGFTLIVFGMTVVGGFFDRHAWAFRLEPVRLASMVAFVAVVTWSTAAFLGATIAAFSFALVCLGVVYRLRPGMEALPARSMQADTGSLPPIEQAH